jgi:hypothetical protein
VQQQQQPETGSSGKGMSNLCLLWAFIAFYDRTRIIFDLLFLLPPPENFFLLSSAAKTPDEP